MKLTNKQLDLFRKNGYLILRNFVDASKCEAILDVALAHLKHKIEPYETEEGYGQKSYDYRTEVSDYRSLAIDDKETTLRRLRQVYDRDILFKNWMESEEIRPILEQILDDQVVITLAHHNSIMTKMPQGSTETRWHQDRRYWRYSDDNLVSIWLALGEENSTNGVLEFIPGSHRMQFSSDQFDEKEYFKSDDPRNKALISTKVSTDLKKGDVVLFHCRLLHRANANRSNKPKISFVYTVKAAQTEALEGTRSSEYPEIYLETLTKS